MSHAVPISDETYQAIEKLARQRGTTPEALAETLLRERLAERQVLLRQNTEWAASLDDALARAARGENVEYDDLESLFSALDTIPADTSDT